MSRLRILNVLRASLAAHVRVPPCWRWADGGIARFRCQHKLVIRECELEKFERSFENIIAGSRAFNRYDSPEAGAVGGEEERRSGREVWGWRSAGGGGEGTVGSGQGGLPFFPFDKEKRGGTRSTNHVL